MTGTNCIFLCILCSFHLSTIFTRIVIIFFVFRLFVFAVLLYEIYAQWNLIAFLKTVNQSNFKKQELHAQYLAKTFKETKSDFETCSVFLFIIILFYCWKLKSNTAIKPFQTSVAFHIKTRHLICCTNQMAGFYLKCNTGLKWLMPTESKSAKLPKIVKVLVLPFKCLLKDNINFEV